MNDNPQANQPFKRAAFIYNPRSGKPIGKSSIIRQIDRIWGEAGRDYSILTTSHRGDGMRLAQEAVAQGFDLIVAVGGDGTLNEIVQGVIGSGVHIGLIPAGSGNGFARHWQIPLDAETAIRRLLTPRLALSDVGMANGHLFLVTFGCGMDAVLAHRYARSKMRGMVAYFYHGVVIFLNYRISDISVEIDQKPAYQGQPMLLSVANAKGFGGGTIIAPDAQADDGILNLCIVGKLPIPTCLYHLPKLFNGRVASIPGCMMAKLTEAVIHLPEPGPIHVDGEPLDGSKDIAIKIMPRALRLALPG